MGYIVARDRCRGGPQVADTAWGLMERPLDIPSGFFVCDTTTYTVHYSMYSVYELYVLCQIRQGQIESLYGLERT